MKKSTTTVAMHQMTKNIRRDKIVQYYVKHNALTTTYAPELVAVSSLIYQCNDASTLSLNTDRSSATKLKA